VILLLALDELTVLLTLLAVQTREGLTALIGLRRLLLANNGLIEALKPTLVFLLLPRQVLAVFSKYFDIVHHSLLPLLLLLLLLFAAFRLLKLAQFLADDILVEAVPGELNQLLNLLEARYNLLRDLQFQL